MLSPISWEANSFLETFRQISESPRQYWISVPWSFSFATFDLKTKTNFEGETLYRAHICDSLRFQNTGNIQFYNLSLGSPEHTKWPSNDFFLIWAKCDSFKDLCQFASLSNQQSLVHDSPQARAQSFFEGIKLNRVRMKLNILSYYLNLWWHCWFTTRSAPVKLLPDGSALQLVVSTCCELSPGWCFALFCGGDLIESSTCSVEMSAFVPCSMMLQEVEKQKVLQSYLLPGSAAMRN